MQSLAALNKHAPTIVLVAFIAWGSGCSPPDDSIRIGLFAPLTGPTATAGQSLRNGALIAVDEINAQGGLLGKQVTLVEYDDRSSPEQAVKAANKLVHVDKVVAIVGSLHSGNILAAAPVLERSQVPTIGAGTSPTWLQQGYTYLFRVLGNSELSAKELAAYAASTGLTRVTVLHGNDEYGASGAAGFMEAASQKGIEILTQESFSHGDRDFTGQFARMQRENPDAVVVWALGDDLGAVTKQLRQAGYAGPILGSEGYTMPQVLEVAGESANGVTCAAQYLIPRAPDQAQDGLTRSFLERYLARFQNMPDSDNAYRGYDAVRIIAEAISRSQSLDGDRVRSAIQNLEDFAGIAGTFTYKGHHGEGIHSMRIFEIRNGEYAEIEKGEP